MIRSKTSAIPPYGKQTTFLTVCLLFLLNPFNNTLVAQDTASVHGWTFLVEPYIMFPYMDGVTEIGRKLELPVDADPGDIFNKLQFGAMLYFEAREDQWAITSDLVYMDLEQNLTPGILINNGSVGAKQFIWEAAALYKVLPFLEFGVGGRLNYLRMSVDAAINMLPDGTEPISEAEQKTWYDPILITRIQTDIHDKWLLQFRGDMGGFSVGSQFTWQLQGYVGYRFTPLFQLSAGYRIISTDFVSGEAPRRFIFDMNEFGPVLRLGFNF